MNAVPVCRLDSRKLLSCRATAARANSSGVFQLQEALGSWLAYVTAPYWLLILWCLPTQPLPPPPSVPLPPCVVLSLPQ